MLRLLKYYIGGALFVYPLVFIGFIFFFPLKLALLTSAIASLLFGLFSCGFMVRTLKVETLEINSTNKDPQKGLDWYQERIFEQLYDLRFITMNKSKEFTTFSPRGLYKIYESDVSVERTPYYIKITASRLVLKLISSYVDLSQ